jgi:hypothetical protein
VEHAVEYAEERRWLAFRQHGDRPRETGMRVAERLLVDSHVGGRRQEGERRIRGCPLDQTDRDSRKAIGERESQQDETELTGRQKTLCCRGGSLVPEPKASAGHFVEQFVQRVGAREIVVDEQHAHGEVRLQPDT